MSGTFRFFTYEHLSDERLKLISHACYELAKFMEGALPESAEKSAGMRKLLEAKDCFVRARLMENESDDS